MMWRGGRGREPVTAPPDAHRPIPDDPDGDVYAWGLNHRQAAQYRGRLSTYRAQRARFLQREVTRLALETARLTKIAYILVGISFALQLAAAILRLAS